MSEIVAATPLRIAFLCGSLEPGRDGVGDYCRLLAAELESHGMACLLISLNGIASASWPDRARVVRERLAQFGADWVSLQFVPYSFHSKGLVESFGKAMRTALAGRKLHIMFHELWIGAYTRAPWKEVCVGFLQRVCIRRLLRSLAPDLVTTTNSAYAALLQELGVEAPLLPLFGNIPIVPEPDRHWIPKELTAGWLFAFFGTLHPVWSPEPLFSQIRDAARRAGKGVAMVSIGRLGPGPALWSRLTERYGDTFSFRSLGEQPADRVSALLQTADFGVAASPWELIGKSGSAAAMLEHGLPVIVSRDDVHFPGFREAAQPEGLVKLDAAFAQRITYADRRPTRSRLPEVARLLASQLLAA